jgi:hypothetical protein
MPQNGNKPKQELDDELDEALAETFPASDATAVDGDTDRAVRPENRQTPKIDEQLVADLSEKAKKKKPTEQ